MIRRKGTEEEDAVLVAEYGTCEAAEIAGKLERSVSSVYTRAWQLGLRCPKSRLVEAGKKVAAYPSAIANRFRKGHAPANKGRKMSSDTYLRVARTMFRKGHMPTNHREVGSERINIYGYIEVKVAEPNVWRQKHRLVWEQEHGPIPEGYNIQFRNGDRQDLRICNLYLISRADQMRNENSLSARYPEELQNAIRARGALKRQISLHNKKLRK